MAADAVLAEGLSRLEHKVDLLLELFLRTIGPGSEGQWLLTQVGDANHVCPVCTQQVQYLVDFLNKVVARKCGCATGKVAPIDLGAFAPPAGLPRLEGIDGHGDQEDRSNPDRRGGNRRR